MKTYRYSSLDWLRILLAIEVVFTHVLGWTAWVPAVPCFVCLSGYFIPNSYDASTNWKHFARKRGLRVLPAFVASMILVYLLMGVGGLKGAFTTYLSAGLLVAVGNGALWSLMVEEVAYASHVLSQVFKFWSLWLIVPCFLLMMGLWMVSYPLHFRPEVIRIIAALASYFAGNLMSFTKPKLWFGLVGVAVYALFHKTPYIALFTYPLLSASVIVLFMNVSLPKIPDLSYGLYVYHVPVLLALHGSSLAVLPLAGLLALASWYLLESPVLKLKNREFQRNTAPALPREIPRTSSKPLALGEPLFAVEQSCS